MSRIGKSPIIVPSNVNITMGNDNIHVKGDKGELNVPFNSEMKITLDNGIIEIERPTEQKRHKAQHGLYRSLLSNAIEGVSKGFENKLELVGVGYKATNEGNVLDLSLGYSHNILFVLPKEVSLTTETLKGKNPTITLASHDKQLLGQITAKVRSLRKIEPYKGKGIRFVGEQIRRKAGKTAAK